MATTKQKLMITHPENTHFEGGGLRNQFLYRELGVAEATGGKYNAHVIKGAPGGKPPIESHKHTAIDFLFVYVLKGWVTFNYEGREETLKAGACHVIPAGVEHSVLDWSENLEMVEVTSPAKYKTEETHPTKAPAKARKPAYA